MSVTVVIPARLGSTRLPGKVLADLNGRPLLWHVWNRVCQARRADQVYVATDAEEVRRAVEGWNGQVLMTSPQCRSGTERIASIIGQLAGDFVLNVQGDEPLIEPALLDALVGVWEQRRRRSSRPFIAWRRCTIFRTRMWSRSCGRLTAAHFIFRAAPFRMCVTYPWKPGWNTRCFGVTSESMAIPAKCWSATWSCRQVAWKTPSVWSNCG